MADFIMKLRSRKFLLAFFGALYIILTDGLGLPIPLDHYNTVRDIIIAYIGVEGAIDLGRVIADAIAKWLGRRE